MKLGVLKIENIMKKTSNWRKLNKQKKGYWEAYRNDREVWKRILGFIEN